MNYTPSLPCIYIFTLAWSAPLSNSIAFSAPAERGRFVFIQKVPGSSIWAGESFYSLSCRHIFKSHPIMMVTGYIRNDGHSSDTPTVTSLTWKCSFVCTVLYVCVIVHMIHSRVSKMPEVGKEEGDDTLRCSWLLVAWVLGSLHTTLIVRETVKECWVKLMDKHLNKRRRGWKGCIHRRYATPPEWQHLLFHWQLLRVCYNWSPSGCYLYCMTSLKNLKADDSWRLILQLCSV